MKPTTLLLLLFTSTALADTTAICYWPDGSQDSDSLLASCNVNPGNASGQRACCGPGEICLSNGLCFSAAHGILYRGGCTDRTWKNNGGACNDLYSTDRNNTFANLMYCYGNSTIHLDTGSCADKNVYTYTSAQLLGVSFTTDVPTSTGTRTSTSTSTGTGNKASATVTLTVTTGVTAAAALETGAICLDSVETSRRNTGLAVGLGIGLPLLAISCLFAALWLLGRRVQVQDKEATQPMTAEPSAWDTYHDNHHDHHKDLPREVDGAELADMGKPAVELDGMSNTGYL